MSRCRYASRRNFISCSRKTGSPVLARYVSELSSRCGLILALYSRPHSSECAVNEHRAIISALAAGDVARASTVMKKHLEAVAGRAMIVARPDRNRDLRDILSTYADKESNGGANGKGRHRR